MVSSNPHTPFTLPPPTPGTTLATALTATDTHGRTALHYAALTGNTSALSTLVSAMHANGVSMDGVDGGGSTAVHYAAQHTGGDAAWVASVRELVGHVPRESLKVKDAMKMTPLEWCVLRGGSEGVAECLKHPTEGVWGVCRALCVLYCSSW